MANAWRRFWKSNTAHVTNSIMKSFNTFTNLHFVMFQTLFNWELSYTYCSWRCRSLQVHVHFRSYHCDVPCCWVWSCCQLVISIHLSLHLLLKTFHRVFHKQHFPGPSRLSQSVSRKSCRRKHESSIGLVHWRPLHACKWTNDTREL